MPAPFDNPAAIACGCNHQQNLSGAVASGDFTNIATNNAADGIYTLNGEACAIGDIIDLDHPDTFFDPVLDIDMDGIKARDAGGGNWNGRSLEINTPLLTTLLTGGFTIVLEAFVAADGVIGASLHDSAFNFERVGAMDAADVNLNGDNESRSWEIEALNLPVPDAVNKLAVTFLAGSISASLNGGTVAGVTDTILADVDNIVLQLNGSENLRLRSFAFYEVVDDTDLPTLSALS